MAVNADKPHLWKADVVRSVDCYNDWFIHFAPLAYRSTRATTIEQVEDTEISRLAIQRRLDAGKTAEDRNRLGQFATPPALARDILAFSRTLLPQPAAIRFLDPAFGTGAFYSALLHTFAQDHVIEANAYEIDPHYGQAARAIWQHTPLHLHITDFTREQPPASGSMRANLLICNPPYVRHHHLSAAEKRRLQQASERAIGMRLSGLAGLYCYFLCLAHRWMADGGLAAWLIPSEFMDVNYGEQIKHYLLQSVTLLHIHRFDPSDVQFDDALVSSAIVWFRRTAPPPKHIVTFSYGGTLAQPHVAKPILAETLQQAPKWTQFPLKSTSSYVSSSQVKLADLFKIQRGLVTGANEFFILSPDQIAEHQLPAEFLTPILPSPRHVQQDEIDADADGGPVLEHRLFLLSCDLPEAQVQARYPALWQYLQRGVAAEIDQRYLCRHRSPWYAQERRPPPLLLCPYMGRKGDRARPFRFILNHSSATAANVYLMLYPRPTLAQVLQGRPDLRQTLARALNQIPLEQLIGAGRVYGGGLHKLEPGELGGASADSVLAALPGLASGHTTQLSMFGDAL